MVIIVVVMMPYDDYMVVVAAVVVVMPIWLRKSAGGQEHKQDKWQILLHVRTVTNAHNNVCAITLLYLVFALKLTDRLIPIVAESLGKASR